MLLIHGMKVRNKAEIARGVRRHFLREEWETFSQEWYRVVRFTDLPFEVLENPNAWKRQDQRDIAYYAWHLAFFRRITLPLTYTFRIHCRNSDLPLAQHPNFVSLRMLWERYHSSCGLHSSGEERQRQKNHTQLETLALRLWLGGYGVAKADDCSPVTDEVLQAAFNLSPPTTGRAVALLGKVLRQDQDTLISEPCVRLGVRSHFTATEWHIAFGTSWGIVSHLAKIPLETFESPSYWSTLATHHISTYAARLAFYQRIRLPLAFCLSRPQSAEDFPVHAIDNFKVLDQLFDQCFPILYKLEVNNSRLKAKIRSQLRNQALAFWLAGYGLRHDHNHKAIDPSILRQGEDLAKSSTNKKVIRLLGILLEHDQQCSGTFVRKRSGGSRVSELEDATWQRNILQGVRTPSSQILYQYVFGELLTRVEGPQVRKSTLSDGEGEGSPMREGLGSISMGTWKGYASALRLFAEWCQNNRYDSIDQCLVPGIADFLREGRPSKSRSIRNGARGALRGWVRWYASMFGTSCPEKKIIPRIVRRSRVSHGKLLDLASAELFIDTLLDDQSPSFSENRILDFRCRRAALIAFATGGRGKSIRLLIKDCLRADHHSHPFLFFHSVKTKPHHEVEVGADVVRWVEELQRVAPSNKIYIPSDTAAFGDGLTEYRLLANASDDGPLNSHTINNFMKRVQRHLWPMKHPNGRPFALHDARRLQAICLTLQEKKFEDIRQRLGQTRVESVLPYVATKPPQYQRWYAQILKEGVWKNISDKFGETDGLPLDQVVAQASRMTNVSSNKDFVRQLIEKTLANQHNPYEVNQSRILPVNMVASGFPRRSHNCTAHELLNCGHTELHCFSCDKYNPDTTMLEDHKAEIFRFMVLAMRSRLAKKQRRNVIERQAVELREESVIALLDQAIPKLFGNRFGLSPVTINKLKGELWASAKQFMKERELGGDAPTYTQALQFIRQRQVSG